MAQQVTTNPAADPATNAIAAGFEISLCRPAVRGFPLSISQSTTRLNAIAAVRAHTIAKRISAHNRMLGSPCAATKVDPIANGKANTVCEKRMNFRVRWRTPNIDDTPRYRKADSTPVDQFRIQISAADCDCSLKRGAALHDIATRENTILL
jgi:hypothetical protein